MTPSKMIRQTGYVIGLIVAILFVLAGLAISEDSYHHRSHTQGILRLVCTVFVGVVFLVKGIQGLRNCSERPFTVEERWCLVVLLAVPILLIVFIAAVS